MRAAVQTHASEPDLFETSEPMPVLEGELLEDAVVRVRAADHGHAVTVLCLHLQCAGPGRRVAHVERPYTDTPRFTVDAIAKSLRRGMHVAVATSFAGAVLTLPNAVSIKAIPTPPKAHAA